MRPQATHNQGISIRSVDALVIAIGRSGISQSRVIRLCEEIGVRVNAFPDRFIERDRP
jgi:putative transposase